MRWMHAARRGLFAVFAASTRMLALRRPVRPRADDRVRSPSSRAGRDNTLGELRRYQRILMYGSVALISAIAIVTLLLQIKSTIERYMTYESNEAYNGTSLIEDDVEMHAAVLRNAVVEFELTWPLDLATRKPVIDRFEQDGMRMTLWPLPTYAQWVVGIPAEHPDRSILEHYLAVAERIGTTNAATAGARGRTIQSYYIDVGQRMATIMPVPGRGTLDSIAIDQAVLASLSAGFEDLGRDDDQGRRPIRWSPPSANPLTGTRTIRMGSLAFVDNVKTQLVVFEFPLAELMNSLRRTPFNGAYILTSSDGKLIGKIAHQPIDDTLVERALALHAANGLQPRPAGAFGNGVILFSTEIKRTGWRLLYVLSWRNIVAALGLQTGIATLLSGSLIVMTWIFVALFERRVFKPAFEHSTHIFDSEHLSRTLIETAPVGLSIVSIESGKPLLSSAMMRNITDVISEHASMLFKAAVAKYAVAPWLAEFDSMFDVAHDEIELTDRDGNPIHLAMSLTKARYKGEKVLVLAFSDITAKKALEQRLRDAKLAADSANASKALFLATMSHEIRTPLNAIMGHLELLANASMTEKQKDRLAIIRNASNGLLVTINDVLDFSKVEAGQLAIEAVDFRVSDIVERSLAIFSPIARAKGIELLSDYACSIEQNMLCDPDRFAQILNNLLGNAIKFTAEGSVTLRTRIRAESPGGAVGPMLSLTVEDTGIGMTPRQRATLFEPFVQADASIERRFGGTGLGLALCRKLVTAMNGAIDVESEMGVGSRFSVRLPLGVPVAGPASNPRFSRERIVFLSTRNAWRDFVVPQLQSWGLDVSACSHPADISDAALQSARVVVIYGSTAEWAPHDENRLVELSGRIVYCEASGPSRPVVIGRMTDVSCYALRGLANALMQAIHGTTIDCAANERNDGFDESSPLPRMPSLRVLVVEDNEANRELLREQMSLLGCEVATACDGRAGLDAMKSEAWDIVLTDINMPLMNGYEFARTARAEQSTVPIVAISASVTGDELSRCKASGISKVLTKPVSLEQLHELLSSVVKGKRSSVLPAKEQQALLAGKPVPLHLKAVFRRSSMELMTHVHQAKTNMDGRAMAAALHSLKGALGVFGLTELARRCDDLERAVANGGISTVSEETLSGFEASLRVELEKVSPCRSVPDGGGRFDKGAQ
ncbi:response regulator [Burkholderia sp. 4701]|nr:response regulator [Burkholderia sp. 4701]MXN80423.1 response regulator [Burkholderia sp. 4812]